MNAIFLFFLLWGTCFSSNKVLAIDNESSASSLVQSRQGHIGSQFLSPNLAGIYPSLDPLLLSGQNNIPFLLQQQQQQLPYAAGLQGLGGLAGLGGLTGLGGLQGINGQGQQDSQALLRRLGGLGLGNRYGNGLVGLPGLGSPFLPGFSGINPALGRGRGIGGQQDSLRNLLELATLLGLEDASDSSYNTAQLPVKQHYTPSRSSSSSSSFSTGNHQHKNHHHQGSEDKELAALLQAFNNLHSLPSSNPNLALTAAAALPPGVGVPRLSPLSRPFPGRGGPIFPGHLNSGFRPRAGLQSDNAAAATNRVGIPASSKPDSFQFFQYSPETPTNVNHPASSKPDSFQFFQYYPETPTNVNHRLQDVETEIDQFRFPNSGR